MSKNKNKAILFDFDGTLINSQPVINEYLDHIFSFRHIHITDEEKKTLGGMSFPSMRKYLAEERGIVIGQVERRLYNMWFILRHLKDIKKFGHVDEVLQDLKDKGYKLGIVSNSPRSYLNFIMRKEGIRKYFDTTVSVTESKVPKPDPKMAVMAARKLDVPFSGCTLIDDNEPGIAAGNTLGMQTIRIGSKRVKTEANSIIQDISNLESFMKNKK